MGLLRSDPHCRLSGCYANPHWNPVSGRSKALTLWYSNRCSRHEIAARSWIRTRLPEWKPHRRDRDVPVHRHCRQFHIVGAIPAGDGRVIGSARHFSGAGGGANGGYIFKRIGDAFCVAFQSASEALAAALESQRALKAKPGQIPGLSQCEWRCILVLVPS